MKKLVIFTLLFGIALTTNCANIYATTTKKIIVKNNTYANSIYSTELNNVEEHLYGNTYEKDSIAKRLNRIEKTLFNYIFYSDNTNNRVNRILAKYQNYEPVYTSNKNNTFKDFVIDRYIGRPTGFTPPIMDYPYSMRNYGYNRQNYSNFIPSRTSTGVTILN